MTYIFLILMILLNVIAFPWIDARQIKKGEEINHTVESWLNLFISIAFFVVLFAGSDILTTKDVEFLTFLIVCVISAVLTRVAFFDYSLNLFRTDGGRENWTFKQRLTYSSKSTSSQVDQLERRLGINENIIRILGIVAFLAWVIWAGRIDITKPFFPWL